MNPPDETPRHVAEVDEHPLRIPARDGYLLGATFYRRADHDANDVVIFNAGGGLAARRYAHFLRYLAREGFPVIAYDYRGVGASRPARLRGFVAGLEDWAELDQAGVIDYAHERFPCARLSSVSHSIGCLVACTAPNASMLHQMVYIGPHTGYWGDYRAPWKWPMALVWHVLMPLIARLCGYFPGASLGLGDDFPLRFALQWAGRRRGAFDITLSENPRETALFERSQDLAVPSLVLVADRDAFAAEPGVRRFLYNVPQSPVVRRDLSSRDATRGPLGHFGFFRRRNAGLWGIVVRFMDSEGNLGSPVQHGLERQPAER